MHYRPEIYPSLGVLSPYKGREQAVKHTCILGSTSPWLIVSTTTFRFQSELGASLLSLASLNTLLLLTAAEAVLDFCMPHI
jgi:hypothetical protein